MVLAGGFFALGVLMFWFTRQFSYNGLQNFGTGFWPRVIAAIMMLCSAVLFVQSMLSKDPTKNEIVIDWKSEGMKRVYLVVSGSARHDFRNHVEYGRAADSVPGDHAGSVFHVYFRCISDYAEGEAACRHFVSVRG